MKLTRIFAGMAASVVAASCLALSASAVELKEGEKETPKFNLILITSDIPADDYDSDDNGDFALMGDKPVKVTNVTLTVGSETYHLDAAPFKSDQEYLTWNVVNTYASDFEGIVPSSIPGEGDTVSIDFTIETDAELNGNVGIAFQTDETWNFRNCYNPNDAEASAKATFPNQCVGVQGGEYGFDTSVACEDAVISGAGDYHISIAASGEINDGAQVFEDGTTRSGYAAKWAMNKSYEPQAEEESKAESGAESKNESKSESGTDSKSDSKADSKSADSSKAADSSKKSSTTTTTTTGKTTTTTSSAAASDASKASDDTNQATGATAGLALAGLAIAGAAAVVSKRK